MCISRSIKSQHLKSACKTVTPIDLRISNIPYSLSLVKCTKTKNWKDGEEVREKNESTKCQLYACNICTKTLFKDKGKSCRYKYYILNIKHLHYGAHYELQP